jgi:hypothetical protein
METRHVSEEGAELAGSSQPLITGIRLSSEHQSDWRDLTAGHSLLGAFVFDRRIHVAGGSDPFAKSVGAREGPW